MSAPLIYGKDGIYRSPRPPISLPQDSNLSMIPFLFRNLSSHHSERVALIDAETHQTLTFSELKTQVFKLSNALLNLNISKKDVVLILSPNSVLFPVSFFAVVAIGAIATTANPQYTVSELSKQIKDSNPKLVITIQELYHKIKNFNLPCVILSLKNMDYDVTTSRNSIWYYSDLIQSSLNASVSESAVPSVQQTDAAAIMYSSGTTGTSKGVVLTHRNFIASALMTTSDQEARGDSKNVFVCFLPMFHISGLSTLLYSQLQRGNVVVVMAQYNMEKMLSVIQEHRVTHLYTVPPVIIALTKKLEVVRKYDVSSLREIRSGAAPLGKDVTDECAKKFPQATVYQAYGMTETCGVISLGNARTISCRTGSTGVLNPGVEAQIISVETMEPLPPFQKGEIWIRGPIIMQGYFKNEKATMETVDCKGWLHTGDVGYFDNEGRLYVVDRIKELIKYKGFQVAPAELEELLIGHPEIVDGAVIGFPDAEAGEVPIAYVVRSSISSLSGDDVKAFIGKQVAPFKRLRMVIFTDAIPKSASGKILRRELRQKFLSKL